jgi:hypothetical protein
MPADPTHTNEADARSSEGRRRRPLVSPDVVRRWAAQVGLTVSDGPLDDETVDLYLYWRDERRTTSHDIDLRRDRPTRPVPGAAPPVSPALLEAASCDPRPEPCPTCGGPGYLDYVDLARGIQRQRCHPCGQHWISAIAHLGPELGARLTG